MTKACSAFAIIVLSLILASGAAFCAPGDLDPVFGVGGKIVVPNGVANAAVFDNEFGRDIIAGEASFPPGDLLLRVVRQIDPSFGENGIVINPDQPHGAADVVLQPDLRIVTLGASIGLVRECSLARYEPNGAIDRSFGGIGTVRQSLPEDFLPIRLALQPDGKYVVVGTFYVNRFSNKKLALLRFNTDGRLDHSFGESGIVSTSLGGSVPVYGFAVALQSDGKIVVGGRSNVYPVVARFLTNGTLDPSFGSSGKVIFNSTDFGSFTANALGVDALDDTIVFAATTIASTTLVRLNPDGGLDDSFNGTGKLSIPNFAAKSLIIGNGGLGPLHQVALAGGVVRFVNIGGRPTQFNTFAVGMVLPNGTLQQSYGKNGIVTTPFTDSKEEYSEARGIVFTESSGLAVATGATLLPDRNVAIARYLGE